MKMTPKNYLENVVLKTWDGKGTQEHCFYGFLEEFGEITGKLKKAHRDDVPEQEKQAGLKKELGDWGVVHNSSWLSAEVD
jgi:NTP pyrophosphatase (non-canonical NTP hydrolase)